jgi:NAD(P)H dehydrogenase (quinone)
MLFMSVLIVFDHPRRSSFCGAVLDQLQRGLAEAGHKSEVADLRAEGFDPRLPVADEPDWDDPDKVYSADVLREQERIMRHDALAFVFPVWWWSFPATTKGWIDRVWNNGWAYGARKLPHRKALMIGTCSGTGESFAKRGYDKAMDTQLLTGIIHYCGIPEGRLELLYDVMADEQTRNAHFQQARELGRTYFQAGPQPT